MTTAGMGNPTTVYGFKRWLETTPVDAEFSDYLSRALDSVEEALVGAGWITPTLGNSWVNDFGYGVRRIGGIVYMRGRLSGGASATAFTLPAGYRPTSASRFLVAQASGSTPAVVVVNTDGTVTLTTGTTPYLSHIAFPVI